jgi:hypothetical protein
VVKGSLHQQPCHRLRIPFPKPTGSHRSAITTSRHQLSHLSEAFLMEIAERTMNIRE